jgi:hypothetical protein
MMPVCRFLPASPTSQDTMQIHYDRFYRYAEFTAILRHLVQTFPRLLSMESIGKSHEGRDIWVLTVTNQDTGVATDKPAYWVDANIHASELAGGAAALYLIDTLTRRIRPATKTSRAA